MGAIMGISLFECAILGKKLPANKQDRWTDYPCPTKQYGQTWDLVNCCPYATKMCNGTWSPNKSLDAIFFFNLNFSKIAPTALEAYKYHIGCALEDINHQNQRVLKK